MTKTCTKCKEEKTLSEFYRDKSVKGGRTAWCGSCWRNHRKTYFAANSDKIRAYDRERGRQKQLKAKYQLTLEEFERMLLAQGGYCAICDRLMDMSCHVDHDHSCCPGKTSCGKCIRALLCSPCNRALGFMKDDPNILQSATDYLRNFS